MRFVLLLLLVLLAGPVHAQSPDSTVVWTVDSLPEDMYAASAFHGDDDGTLDTNLFGGPSEPFGFSNDTRARLGWPDFAEVAFRFAAPRDKICFRVQ